MFGTDTLTDILLAVALVLWLFAICRLIWQSQCFANLCQWVYTRCVRIKDAACARVAAVREKKRCRNKKGVKTVEVATAEATVVVGTAGYQQQPSIVFSEGVAPAVQIPTAACSTVETTFISSTPPPTMVVQQQQQPFFSDVPQQAYDFQPVQQQLQSFDFQPMQRQPQSFVMPPVPPMQRVVVQQQQLIPEVQQQVPLPPAQRTSTVVARQVSRDDGLGFIF